VPEPKNGNFDYRCHVIGLSSVSAFSRPPHLSFHVMSARALVVLH